MADVIIQYGKSTSKQFKSVLKKSKEFSSFTQKDDLYFIEFRFSEILNDWNSFHEVFIIVAKWASFKMRVRSDVYTNKNAFKFYYIIQDIKNCYKNYLRFNNIDRYCIDTAWKCVHINSIKTRPYDYGTFWYSLGHFSNDFSEWFIHKEEMKHVLSNEIDKKGLTACPAFCIDRVFAVLDTFPDRITLKNNPDFKIVTEKRFVGASIIDIPVGIVHVIDDDNPSHQSGFGVSIDAAPMLKEFFGEGPAEETNAEAEENPYLYGTDDWTNWEIENYQRQKEKRT